MAVLTQRKLNQLRFFLLGVFLFVLPISLTSIYANSFIETLESEILQDNLENNAHRLNGLLKLSRNALLVLSSKVVPDQKCDAKLSLSMLELKGKLPFVKSIYYKDHDMHCLSLDSDMNTLGYSDEVGGADGLVYRVSGTGKSLLVSFNGFDLELELATYMDSTRIEYKLVGSGDSAFEGLTRGYLWKVMYLEKSNVQLLAYEPSTLAYESQWSKFITYIIPLGVLTGVLWVILLGVYYKHHDRLQFQLKRCLKHFDQHFFLEYQPVFDIVSKKIIGCEALIRWRDEAGHLVNPDHFVPVLERSHLINQLTHNMATTALTDLAPVLHAKELYLSLNVSPNNLYDFDAYDHLMSLCAKYDIPPSQIVIEITEREILNYARASKVLAAIRKAGFRIALDDFGEGSSNFSYLKNIQPDFIKIDKSFIDAMSRHGIKASLIPEILYIANQLAINVIAEGVESEFQEEELLKQGITHCQGWLYSRPLSKDAITEILKN